MSFNKLPFHQSALEGSVDDLDAESVALEQDEKAENAKEKEPISCRIAWNRISFCGRSTKKMTYPFLSEENEKDPVLLRSINKNRPFAGLGSEERHGLWQRVADDVNSAKSVSTGEPLVEREVTARYCKNRFMQLMKFIEKYKGKDNAEGPGEILLAIQHLYEEFKNCVVKGNGEKLKWKKRNILSESHPVARKRIVLDNDVMSKEEDSSASYREKARMLREQNIARKLKLKAFELKLKEKALVMKEEEAEHRRKENKETRDQIMKMYNSFQAKMCNSLQTFMSTMESTTHGTTSTSLPKVDNTLVLTDRNKNGQYCESEEDDDDDIDIDDDSSNSTPSHYCLP